MSRLIRRRSRRSLVIAAWATSLLIVAAATATGASMITGKQIKNGSVSGVDIKNGSLGWGDLSSGTRTRLINRSVAKSRAASAPGAANAPAPGAQGPKGDQGGQGAQGPQGPQGPRGADGVAASLGANFVAEGVVIAKIGGSFTANATDAGEFTLAPGTYVVNGHAFYDRITNAPVGDTADANASSPALQLAIRGPVPAGGTWGVDYGTGFTAPFPATGNMEQTVATSRVVTVTEPTKVDVYVFGYNEDRSAKGSGNYFANVYVNAVRVA